MCLSDREGLELEVTGKYEAQNKVLSSTTSLLEPAKHTHYCAPLKA
jgi:hypothetical protein